jgi:hypothetical protein
MRWSGSSVAVASPLIKTASPGTEFAGGYRMTDEEETVGAVAWTATSAGVS